MPTNIRIADVPVTVNTANVLALVNDPNDLTESAEGSARLLDMTGYLLPLAGGVMAGDITFSGTQLFDGRDVSADGAIIDALGTTYLPLTGGTVDYLQLSGGTGDQGRLEWDTDEETLSLVVNGDIIHTGQDLLWHVRNNSGGLISKGEAVYATGTLGASGRITVGKFIANGTIPDRFFLGLAFEDIADGTDGKISTFGKIRSLDTSGWLEGDLLFPSPTVAGELVNVEPTAPNQSFPCAIVISSHASTGTIAVRVVPDDHNEHLSVSGGTMTGDITFAGTQLFDGRDVSADGSKLDGIEAGATADQSDAEIETAYNNQVSVVSQGDAEAGVSTTVYRWTPERVKQAIAALTVSGGFAGIVDATLAANLPVAPADGDEYIVTVAGDFEESALIYQAGAYFEVGCTIKYSTTLSKWVKREGSVFESTGTGGSILNLTEHSSDPLTPATGDVWLLVTGGQVFLKAQTSIGLASVELTV